MNGSKVWSWVFWIGVVCVIGFFVLSFIVISPKEKPAVEFLTSRGYTSSFPVSLLIWGDADICHTGGFPVKTETIPPGKKERVSVLVCFDKHETPVGVEYYP